MPAQYSAPAWGQSPFHDLELPSGGTIQVKQVDLQTIVAADLIDEFDKLAPTAEEKVVAPAKGKRPSDHAKKKPTKAEAAQAEESSLKEFFNRDNIDMLTSLMDRILPHVVIQPKIHAAQVKDESGKWHTLEHADREEGVIYVDTVPLADQMAILEFAMRGMDMDGLQQFREQPEPPVAVLAPEPKPPLPSE